MLHADLSRRRLLAAAAALPLAPALARPAAAAAPMLGGGSPGFHRFVLGEFEVTTLLAGSRVVENPGEIFGLNADPAEFAAAAAEAFIPTDRARFYFTPTLVNTGGSLVLFDTGLSPAGITAALAAAGYTPDQVDTVVLTHMHGDHIGGLMADAGETFPNAVYVTGAAEHNHWTAAGNEVFDRNVRPLSERMTFLDDGGSVTSGITAVAATGHTPGHFCYMIESEGQQLMLIADLANHFVWSVGRPDWEVRFDMDKAAAAASRRRVLGMLAADRVPFVGYHMPFPALGYVAAQGEGFRYVPASYQMLLED